MTTPYNPNYPYQPFQSQGQAAYPPPVDYGTIDRGPPPAYVYQPDQPAYNYQPQLANTTVVVAAQPVTATTAGVSPPEENHSGIAICALVFSLCTLFTCGSFLICLALSIPAVVLAIVALGTRGRSQKTNAGVSIGLNVAVVVCSVVLVVAVVIPVSVISASTHYCYAYYSSLYNTYCAPYSYATQGSCTYYDVYYYNTYGGYCPT